MPVVKRAETAGFRVAEGADAWLLDDPSVDGEAKLYFDVPSRSFKVGATAPIDTSVRWAGAPLTLWADVRSSGDPARLGFRQVLTDVVLVAEQLAYPEASAPVLEVSEVLISQAGTQPDKVFLGLLKSPHIRLALKLSTGNFSSATWKRADPLGGVVVPQGGLLAW